MPNLKRVTIGDLISWGPCYTVEKIADLANGRADFDVLEMLAFDDVPIPDRFWVVLRDEMLPPRVMQLWAADCAEHVLPIFERERPDDPRPRTAIDAARDAAGSAAGSAAWAAARDAAGSAAGSAAWAAARAAAWAAAWAAARDVEREWQLRALVARVTEYANA